ncbi:hypothetical protein [Patiriisocius marinus]|nr:hypothetical protein [Patiriisocius marinus]
MEDKNKKDTDKQESLNPDRIKGPQKEKHQNQYGNQDERTRVQ